MKKSRMTISELVKVMEIFGRKTEAEKAEILVKVREIMARPSSRASRKGRAKA